jgi:hypothetical protein
MAAIQMESYFTDENRYPANVGQLEGFNESAGVTVTIEAGATLTQTGFCLEAEHDNLPDDSNTYRYDTRADGEGTPVLGECDTT